jgi:hypothetical protein
MTSNLRQFPCPNTEDSLILNYLNWLEFRGNDKGGFKLRKSSRINWRYKELKLFNMGGRG